MIFIQVWGACLQSQEAEAEEMPQVQGQLGLHTEFKPSLHYIVRPSHKKFTFKGFEIWCCMEKNK